MSAPLPGPLRPPQWRAAAGVLQQVLNEARAADLCLQQHFAQHRQMGSRDRRLVSTLVYGVLRDAMRLRAIAGEAASGEAWLALHLLAAGQADTATLAALGCAEAARWQQRLQDFDEAGLSEAARANVPEPVWALWCEQYGRTQTRALAAALNQEAPVDLRVNTLKASRAQVLAALQAAGIEAQAGALSEDCVRLPRRVALQTLDCYRQGWVEPQDQGSQLLARHLGAQPGERIADYCAGAGGKTLAIGAAMAGRGELWALDVDAARLRRLPPRAERAALAGLQLRQLPDAEWLLAQAGSFDAVLVDAPCSGSGTWRRNPELRLRALDLPALAARQLAILCDAATLLRSGGRLVYATCSLLAAENEAVIQAFCAGHPDFMPDPDVPDASPAQRNPLRLLPQLHGCDGFFAMRLRRR
ncbi:16S rRNA (cytosine967-C5)-methyltransferase [Solimonas aquatica]|uniref:16S rRNA (Cytosine967-C5)-methyltransferase n=1 Tax=Solimonas aquatica TaxID=489703 RepID=A0A1H9GVA2_9GAMM|nr:RsmB/NOP family class I SAM-dependent RNA methyltransferase [Solimonas aquatica]SEQ53950.1 16S rRNA (cytosine967-C5)-methyltransferase [Solimonas aquatica]